MDRHNQAISLRFNMLMNFSFTFHLLIDRYWNPNFHHIQDLTRTASCLRVSQSIPYMTRVPYTIHHGMRYLRMYQPALQPLPQQLLMFSWCQTSGHAQLPKFEPMFLFPSSSARSKALQSWHLIVCCKISWLGLPGLNNLFYVSKTSLNCSLLHRLEFWRLCSASICEIL